MDKFKKFLKTVPMKLYIILTAIFVISFFSNDFDLVDIQKTAVILAAGLDRTEEGFHVTAQIAVPKGSDRSSCGTASIDVQGDGKTVSDCITQIYSKTGWVPKLIFCNLILIGENTARDSDVFDGLDFFLRNEYMQDSCLIATCEGSATEMLTSISAIDDTTSQSIEKVFSGATEKSGTVLSNTLKEFAIGYFGQSKSGYMPYVRAINQDCGSTSGGGEGSSASGSAGGGGSGGQESSGGGKGDEQKKIYYADRTALFSEGKMVAILNPEQTFAYSLLQGNVFAGTMTAEDKGKPVTLSILADDGGISLDVKNKPKATLSLDLKIRLFNRGVPSPIEDISDIQISPEITENATAILEGYLNDLWNTCKTSGCDLFNLKRSLYRSSLKKYAEWKDTLLETVDCELAVKIQTVK